MNLIFSGCFQWHAKCYLARTFMFLNKILVKIRTVHMAFCQNSLHPLVIKTIKNSNTRHSHIMSQLARIWPDSTWALIQYKNMLSYQYRKSHCEDKMVIRSSYLHNGKFYTGKTASLQWISPLKDDRDPLLTSHGKFTPALCKHAIMCQNWTWIGPMSIVLGRFRPNSGT